MKEATAVLGFIAGVIVVFTFFSRGGFSLGTSPTGPYLNLQYK